jgi:hypothetical protein
MDPDPDADPAIFIQDLHDVNKKILLFSKFLCLLLFEDIFTTVLKIKSHKEVKKQ